MAASKTSWITKALIEVKMRKEDFHVNTLPKWVIGGVDPRTGKLGFLKNFMETGSKGEVILSDFHIKCFETKEEADEYYQAEVIKNYPKDAPYRVINSDQLSDDIVASYSWRQIIRLKFQAWLSKELRVY